MRLARVGIAFALVLGLFGVVLTWPAVGQVPVGQGPASDFVTSRDLATMSADFGQGKRDPEMTKLISSENSAAFEVNRLIADYKRTDKDEEKAKIKTKLGDALTKQFDAQQKRRDLELTRLEEKVKKVRALMKKRDEERKTIVDKRLDQLVREAEGLGWGPPPRPTGTGSYGPPTTPSWGNLFSKK
jgi:hypothetical protein